jgi:D-alanyl-D-alanine carboxypeptidase (penicillin-binding protein 5/6)
VLEIRAKGAVLMDLAGGRVLYEQDADEELPIASVTKVMTLLLAFEAMDGGVFTPETVLTCSPEAAAYGGSQIWLEPGEQMSVEDLLKAVAVVSANDACAVLAEAVDGSVEGFVAHMNRRAAELGMAHTRFLDCCGLEDGARSTARDVALMSRALMTHPEVTRYTTIWMDTLREGRSELVNTNKLIRFYDGATGLKTGTTAAAGHCLSATALRGGMGLCAVVLGCASSSERFADAKALLNWGFANYALVHPAEGTTLSPIPVKLGTAGTVTPVLAEPGPILIEKGQQTSIRRTVELPETLTAPVEKGEIIGTLTVCAGDTELARLPLTADADVGRLTFSALCLSLLRAMCGGE